MSSSGFQSGKKNDSCSFEQEPLLTSRQSYDLDHKVQKRCHLPADLLMEQAGSGAAKEYLSDVFQSKAPAVFCGSGRNGGDGLVMARHLFCQGLKDILVFCAPLKDQLCRLQKKRCEALGIKVHSLFRTDRVLEQVKQVPVFIDALFGVGLDRPLTGFYKSLVEALNLLKKPVYALDTPSGLDIHTGCEKGTVFKAYKTLTFAASKPGFYLGNGISYAGQVKVIPLSVSRSYLRSVLRTHTLVQKAWVAGNWPKRQALSHKADHGHLLVLAGSDGLLGSAILSALSAYRLGVGYVSLAGQANMCGSQDVLFQAPEVLTTTLDNPRLLHKKTAVAIGPGLGVNKVTLSLIKKLKAQKANSVVVDADAFTVCCKNPEIFPMPQSWVLTPHSGELARLFKKTGARIERDRIAHAMKASQMTGATILLKGRYSVVACEDKCWIVPTGNSALAKAGTGDVLTGFIGALLARGVPSLDAALMAGYVHGLMAEYWEKQGKNLDTLLAGDLKDLVPLILSDLQNP